MVSKGEMLFNFHSIAFEKLIEDKEVDTYLNLKDDYTIPFPLVFKRMCTIWHLNKRQCFMILKDLEKMELIKILPYHGIRFLNND